MHKVINIFIITFSLTTSVKVLNGQILDSIFHDIRYNVKFEIKEEYSQSQKNILAKLKKGLSKNDSLLKAGFNSLENMSMVEYDSRMGISRAEFDTLVLAAFENRPLAGEAFVIVTKKKGIIHFEGKGKLSFLDSLIINLDENWALFGKRHLYLMNVRKLSKEYIPENEGLESILAFNANDIREMEDLHPNNYVLFIGRLTKSRMPYIFMAMNEYKQDIQQETLVRLVFE